jgi:DNA-binding MarR family transcriptional regulator
MTEGNHPRFALDDVLMSSVRFSIVAALAEGHRVEFAFLRDIIEVSDSVLSKQVTLLESEGMVKAHKGYVGKRPRTWLSITTNGAKRYGQHVKALEAVIATRSVSIGAAE